MWRKCGLKYKIRLKNSVRFHLKMVGGLNFADPGPQPWPLEPFQFPQGIILWETWKPFWTSHRHMSTLCSVCLCSVCLSVCLDLSTYKITQAWLSRSDALLLAGISFGFGSLLLLTAVWKAGDTWDCCG